MTVRYLLDTNICIYISKKRPLEPFLAIKTLEAFLRNSLLSWHDKDLC